MRSTFWERATNKFHGTRGKLPAAAVLMAIILTAILYNTFEGYQFYLLEPGPDDGYVHARYYTWWGMRNRYFVLRRLNRYNDLFEERTEQWYIRIETTNQK